MPKQSIVQMLAHQQQYYLVWTKLNKLLSRCSHQLPMDNKKEHGNLFISHMYYLVCSLQNIPPTAQRAMCARICPLFFLSVDDVERRSIAKYGTNLAKKPMGARNIYPSMHEEWNFLLQSTFYKKYVECIWSALFIPPNARGTVWPAASHKLNISSLQKFHTRKMHVKEIFFWSGLSIWSAIWLNR